MPYLHLSLGRPLPAATQATLAKAATELLHIHLRKRAEVTAVRIELHGDHCFIGGEAVSATCPCHAEVCITAGSNTPDEKARFLQALHQLLSEHCGPLALATYLVIREYPASDWGYGGLTQASRHTAASTA